MYYTDEAQREISEEKIKWAEEKCGQKLAIAVEPYKNFYPAEEYHQDYYLKNPEEFEKELIESGRKSAPEKKKKLKAPKRARDIIIISFFCIVALLTIFSYLVELPAFSGIEEQLTSNVMNNLESSDEYQVAYNYFLESEIFARLDAKEEDISFHGSNKSTSFGLSGKDSTYTLSLSLYGGVYEIVCHENESGWYVCTDCTQVK